MWSIADITRDRERQEDVFQELQHAIEYLDHAPCGFFSVNAAGELAYVNATLANWLDHDLAEIGSGGLKLTDIVSGDGASLLTSIVRGAGRGEDRGVRHRPAHAHRQDHAGAALSQARVRRRRRAGRRRARWCISRARDERADPQRAAEVRFMRFFDHTPMAIATVDRAGNVVRANARFAKLAQSARARQRGRKSIFRAVSRARPRSRLIAAINQAAEGQGDIAPVEAALDGSERALGPVLRHRRSRRTSATPKPPSSTCSRPPSSARWRTRSTSRRRWRSVGQLAGGIAHDFNNVLSAIMMATDFLLNAHKPTDPSFQDIMQIKQNANRAASLVRQLLAFSRGRRCGRRCSISASAVRPRPCCCAG